MSHLLKTIVKCKRFETLNEFVTQNKLGTIKVVNKNTYSFHLRYHRKPLVKGTLKQLTAAIEQHLHKTLPMYSVERNGKTISNLTQQQAREKYSKIKMPNHLKGISHTFPL